MDYKELIESGKLELYALGALDSQDAKEIESILANNPEVRAEYESIADALTEYGTAISEEPPMAVLEKAKMEIESLENQEEQEYQNQENAKVLAPAKQLSMYRWMTIAASVLLVSSVGLNIKLNQDLQHVQNEYLALESQNNLMASNTVQLQNEKTYLDAMVEQISASGVVKTHLGSTNNYQGYESTVFWDKTNATVVLSTASLPELNDDSQYQLWAIVDGKPVDAGIFTSKDKLVKMKEITGEAVAFAVTIEPKGGSISPTLEKMCMIGNIAS